MAPAMRWRAERRPAAFRGRTLMVDSQVGDCEAQTHVTGGRGGIRTHGTLAGTPVFKTGALNRSATLPTVPLMGEGEADCKAT